MTPHQLRCARVKLKKSPAEFAAMLGMTERAIRYYEAGQRPISGPVALAVNCLLEHPQPTKSRRR